MKKGVIIAVLFLLAFALLPLANAECNMNISLINQDPYPAIPGDTVKVVFQINGTSDPDCGVVTFGVHETFPFTIDPESANPTVINAGVYAKRYSSFYIAPYKIRIDEDAVDGDTPIEVYYSSSSTIVPGERVKDFNINIEDTRADFEVYVKDYDYTTKILTLEILNIEDVDVEALTIEIPKQDNIEVKKTNKVVVGDLDSNEYTTADFEAIMKDGEIGLNIAYSDSADIRRTINKIITFDSGYFDGLNRDKSTPYWIYILPLILIAGFFIWRIYRKRKIKKRMHNKYYK